MVNFTVDEIARMMDYPDNIRNISVIAHVDHGKSTLTDSLIGAAGIIAVAQAGDARFMDTRKDEQERTITIKATAVSLYFEMEDKFLEGKSLKTAEERKASNETLPWGKPESSQFLINLIDSPGHVDFSSEVTAALRVTDGALVVVDCIEGVCVQTETVLRQAISEMIKPILWVNKLDRVFLELHMDVEEAFGCFRKAIESVNVNIATYSSIDDDQVQPTKGKVGFGAGLHGWGFNLNRFARLYASKFGVAFDKMMQKLWGDNFFNPTNKKWTTSMFTPKGAKLERAFCTFIMKPIRMLTDAIMDLKPEIYVPMLAKLGVEIPKDAKDLTGKPLLKRVMQTWLPAAETLLQMIVNHLPSPRTAQSYRMAILYSGPHDDQSALAIKACDANGPLMMYVSKMVPTSEKGRFYAFGRVFSGRIATGQVCRLMGPDFEFGKKTDLHIKKIQRTVLMMGRYVEQLPSCPCGNIIGLVGVDSYLLKAGTVATAEDAYPFHTMKYSVSPVVRVAVEVKNASDLPKLMEGLKRLAKSDPLVLCTTAPTGEHIVAGAGELHLEICLKDLQEDFMKGAPLIISDPVVSFRETVDAETSMDIIAKSPNKHNRVYLRACPLGVDFCAAVDAGTILPDGDMKARARIMADEYGWDVTEARKLWTFGCPPDAIANVLVDVTKGVQYMAEIKDSMVGAFIQASAAGIIAEEAMRGCRFNVLDVTMHADAIHRGAGQMMPPTKRAMYACQIKSEPRILEPMYLCDITVPQDELNGVYATLNARRGEVDSKEDQMGTPITKIRAYVPVLESFGFTGLLREKTHGKAFPQMIFDKWQVLNGNPFEVGTQANSVVLAARKRKGLKEGLPDFNDYYDKM
jgi:elongation factor 2